MTRLTYQLARMTARMIASIRQPNETLRGTRVLMFHDLHELTGCSDLYSMPASTFNGGMSLLSKWMKQEQTDFVPFSSQPRPGVAITFDDGYRSTLYIAAEILISLQIPFHIFVTKSFVDSGGARYLRDSDLKQLASMPSVTFGVHGVSHDRMPTLSDSQLRKDLEEARDWLEQLTGTSISTLSYPHGAYTTEVASLVEASGFTAAACSNAGTFTSEQQRMVIPRIDMWSRDTGRVWIDKIRGGWDHLLP
jgi:peptidoglycan/xylan/chitin deacetylase (PgdA/CDA1 family)